MALIVPPREEVLECEVVPRAEADGSRLVQRETDTGQLVWTWHRGPEPGPSFLTRREAVFWMHDRMEHHRSSA
jgi:hypothetical protein